MWEDWAERLTDPDVPSEAALHFARNGSTVERWQLTSNEAIPEAAMVLLVEDSDEAVSEGMATNYGITSELLERLIELHPELENLVNQNQNASVARKMKLPLAQLFGGSLDRFFRDVAATEKEQERLHEIIGDTAPNISVEEAWEAIRPNHP